MNNIAALYTVFLNIGNISAIGLEGRFDGISKIDYRAVGYVGLVNPSVIRYVCGCIGVSETSLSTIGALAIGLVE